VRREEITSNVTYLGEEGGQKSAEKSVSYYLNGPKDKLMVSKQEEQNIEVS
jgi:hypothetical protein